MHEAPCADPGLLAGRWDEAAKYYGRAAELAPAFSFAACNQALATYQMGEQEPSRTEEAVRQMRSGQPPAKPIMHSCSCSCTSRPIPHLRQRGVCALQSSSVRVVCRPVFTAMLEGDGGALRVPKSVLSMALLCRRNLLRKYPDFPDVRAALAAALWAQGDGGEAEANWFRVEDPR